MTDESEATVWTHRRLEGDRIITTAGLAKSNPTDNEHYHRNVELRIEANHAIWYFNMFEWGAEDVDTSLLPVLEATPPSYFQPDDGEDVEAFAVLKGDGLKVIWNFLPVRKPNVSTLHIGLFSEPIYDSEDDVEIHVKNGVHATSVEEPNEKDGVNTTTASIEITHTSSESNLGQYGCSIVSNNGQTYIFLNLAVFPQWIMRTISEEPVVPVIWHNGVMSTDGGHMGMVKGQPGQIMCTAIGYPVNDITILRDNLQDTPIETVLTPGK